MGPGGLIAESDELLVYECDGYTIAKSAPDAVVFPGSTEQAARVMHVLRRPWRALCAAGSWDEPGGRDVARGRRRLRQHRRG